MPSIGIADKNTLNLVKANTDLIGSPNPVVGGTDTLFKFLKKLEENLIGSGLLGPYENRVIHRWAPVSGAEFLANQVDDWITIAEVEGAGALTDFWFHPSANSSVSGAWKAGCRIWIDGVKVLGMFIDGTFIAFNPPNYNFDASFFSSHHVTGTDQNPIMRSKLISIPTFDTFDTLPFVDESMSSPKRIGIISEYPIPFKNSFKMEVYAYTALAAAYYPSCEAFCRYLLK